ncbi:MAG TPA: LysR family transcriptional regulator [Usitatibacter sp.]|jgi:DNA-binding transcriptional LysR family regulator|nr:LysR family transcriptional regulator [Usitatibacter sp.]
MDRDNLGTLSAFAVVAQERSFTRAAARLGVSPSALSHAIRRLEEKLGTQLLARSTRSVSMTQAGERLLARVGPAMEELSSAVQELGAQAGRPAGHVRISAPAEAAHRIILPMLPRFVEAYPDIVVEVLVEAAFTDIVARRLDAGVRLGESLAKDVVAVPISGPQRLVVIASPAYVKAHGTPKSPRELRDHRCINQRLLAAGSLYKWEFARGREKMEVAVEGPLVFDDGGMVLEAVLAGIGLGYVMEERALPYLQSGRLVRVLDDWTPPFPGFYLYYPGRKQASAALAAFIDAIRLRPGKRR